MYGSPQICGYRINLVDLKAGLWCTERFCGSTDQSDSHVLDYVRRQLRHFTQNAQTETLTGHLNIKNRSCVCVCVCVWIYKVRIT